ncbi:MAG TPA: thymidine phosphorylase [Coprothermobacter proteolyticus]|nr:thymidine phosphorylase [Coprothermobacter proteolyticus]HOP45632.1 thymidine phosphorylase [Coprothermobacter proteolyticus]HPU69903.1 thymidine phosphorylase [Coprothermobacter proteolyticus]HPZ44558.1 thymidine phosphorylase [Coprothermobacter proteolyticus]HQD07334.1 thymidine phosphorylase [Coprothermobacter proteolyticus]
MLPQEFIRVKRDGEKHTRDSMKEFFSQYLNGNVADYQISAWLMAAFLKGLDDEETFWLTEQIVNSGEKLDLSDIDGIKVDKHSSGGVGDKVSLAIVPLLASTGLVVSKMSGRGLGHTGGTIDKLESIPGLRTEFSTEEFKALLRRVGLAIVSQSESLAPLDKKLYSLRDVTATVESLPLIASSIMSKKIAVGSDLVSLDVKLGNGAFITSLEDAKELCRIMMSLAEQFGRKVEIHVTDMNEPLGCSVGNSLEVIEALEFLKGKVENRFATLVKELYKDTVNSTGVEAPDVDQLIASGKPLEKFAQMIEAQSGDPKVVEDYSLLPMAKNVHELRAQQSGYLAFVDTKEVGMAVVELGGGRKKKEDNIDHGVGIKFLVEGGSKVDAGDIVALVYFNNENTLNSALKRLEHAFTIMETEPQERPLIWWSSYQ